MLNFKVYKVFSHNLIWVSQLLYNISILQLWKLRLREESLHGLLKIIQLLTNRAVSGTQVIRLSLVTFSPLCPACCGRQNSHMIPNDPPLYNPLSYKVHGICKYEISFPWLCYFRGKRNFAVVIKVPNKLTLI